MPNFIAQVASQTRELSRNLSISQKLSLIMAVSAVLAVVMLTAVWSKKPQYKLLYSGVNGENVAGVVALLDEQKIPYRLSSDGMGVSVPSDKVQEARLMMSGDGALMGGGVGFELFDEKNIGMTEFMQKLNFQRALQGELARTISQLSEIEQARVHIVMPEESLFKENEKDASASVVVRLKRGRILRQSQINGVTQLVANAVKGLEAEGVTILDSRGNVLTRARTDGSTQTASSNLEIQHNFERAMEKKLTSMLDPSVGRGKSIVRVSATMDFKQTEKVEEIFDPDSVVVRSEQRSEESHADSEGMPGGVPGVKSNLQGGRSDSSAMSNSTKKNETINYELSRITKKTVSSAGKLERLTVAVLIDGTYETSESGEKKYIPRKEEELKAYENLLKKVVGFSAERGDELEVASMPFETVATGLEVDNIGKTASRDQFWISIARNVSIAVIALLFFLFIIRPLVKWMIAPVENNLLLEGGPKTVREIEASLFEETELSEKTVSIKRIQSSAKSNPEMVHGVIRGWIEE